jgi:hypothetical protein
VQEEDIRSVLNSIGDLNTYVEMNRRPVDAMIALLKNNFSRTTPEQVCALSGVVRCVALPPNQPRRRG